MLVALKSADDLASERVLIDPNQMDAKGGIGIDFYVPSRGRQAGGRLAVEGRQRERRRPRLRRRPPGRRCRRRGAARERRHRGRQRRVERGRDGLLVHALPARRASGRPPISISTSRSISTSWARPPARTRTRIGKELPAHRRDRAARVRRRAIRAGARWRTATAASSRITCARPHGEWTRSRGSRTRSRKRRSGRAASCTCLTRHNAPMGQDRARSGGPAVTWRRPRWWCRRARSRSKSFSPTAQPAVRVGPGGRTGAGARIPARRRHAETVPTAAGLRGATAWCEPRGDEVLLRSGTFLDAAGVAALRLGIEEADAHGIARDRRRPISATPRWSANSRPRRTAPRCR